MATKHLAKGKIPDASCYGVLKLTHLTLVHFIFRFRRTACCTGLTTLLLDALLSLRPESPVGVECQGSAVSGPIGVRFIFEAYSLCVLRLFRHNTVFINLSDKPEWYLEIFPAGKVPALIYDGKFLSESLLLADFLDEQYAKPPLWNASPLQKILDKMFIESFGKVSAHVLPAIM